MKILLACLGIAILLIVGYVVLTTAIDEWKHPSLYLDELLAEVDNKKDSSGVALLIIDPFEQDPSLEQKLRREAEAFQDYAYNEFVNQYKKKIQTVKEALTNQGYNIIDRSKMDLVLQELEFQSSYWSNEEKTVALGRSINADFIVSFSYVMPSSAGQNILSSTKKEMTISINVMDINTHSSRVYSFEDRNSIPLSKVDGFSASVSTDFANRKWFFDGIKKSSYRYKGNAVAYITPFASSYPLKDASLGNYKKTVGKLSYLEFFDSYVNIGYTDGRVEKGSYWFEESAAELIRLSKENASSNNIGKSYSTCKIGTISIRDASGSLIAEGTLFYYKTKLGILLDSSSKVVSFMMFGR